MREVSIPSAGCSPIPRTWTSTSVPFPRELGCALVRSKSGFAYTIPIPRTEYFPSFWLGLNTDGLVIYSVAFAEITIVMAYIFQNYKLSLPSDFQRPKQKDLFTMEYGKPGLPVKFEAVN
ncbi:unnamed protein product [Aspergillus oryzae]|uniref:Unnamed protein product n=2 Tax=Aspergillus oryzae TaxID=5062 RepID=A0AAN4Y6E5_ASPOZ|nr:unnamed protein product [Aspergillus oryzae]GMF94579.1 unnamed protein product [Aspergillus oryzae]GMG01085.1 unnamed protein product [Aspergillus oryzae]GMG22758.1 unnamed protein product [Aspergillus oryzae]GMG44807.1 unnamed protein product [Aspergillus oryzae var. brunneus]